MATKEEKPGYVYILTNPSFREDWVKIGKSARPVDVRSKELDNTAVPLPFEIYATMKTVKYNEAERLVHKYIERFTNLRIRNNREFFNVKPEEAFEIFKDVSMVIDDVEIEVFAGKGDVQSHATNIQINQKEGHRKKAKTGHRSPLNFMKMGMQKGDTLHFRRNPSITIKVNSARSVLYQDNEYAISALTRDLLNTSYYCDPGPNWIYNGKLLREVYNETYSVEE